MDEILNISALSKSFGDTAVLKGISLLAGRGEFITLLGPSGCGKTTTLRIIAGLETPDGGRILLNGEDITDFPPEKRKVNTVFQNYALFPHMDVYGNIAYGLKLKKAPGDTPGKRTRMSKADIQDKVEKALRLVQMEGYDKRRPEQLSGGQRQRIAIARALVNEPEILLLDEPLGALDLKLRHHMQAELKAIQRELRITFIYVTHDQEEALNMSDRLVVMDGGVIKQAGEPKEVYDYPENIFVAEFVGDRNIFSGKVQEVEGARVLLRWGAEGKEVNALAWDHRGLLKNGTGTRVTAAIHTDRVMVSDAPFDGFSLEGVVMNKHFSGAQAKLEIRLLNGGIIKKAEYGRDVDFSEGDRVYVSWEAARCQIVEVEV